MVVICWSNRRDGEYAEYHRHVQRLHAKTCRCPHYRECNAFSSTVCAGFRQLSIGAVQRHIVAVLGGHTADAGLSCHQAVGPRAVGRVVPLLSSVLGRCDREEPVLGAVIDPDVGHLVSGSRGKTTKQYLHQRSYEVRAQVNLRRVVVFSLCLWLAM